MAEKIGVVSMFILVMVVFSLAERDTQKIIQNDSRTAGNGHPGKKIAAEHKIKLPSSILTRK